MPTDGPNEACWLATGFGTEAEGLDVAEVVDILWASSDRAKRKGGGSFDGPRSLFSWKCSLILRRGTAGWKYIGKGECFPSKK